MKNIELLGSTYEIIKYEKNMLNYEELVNLFTDYFLPYDYILGDYSYGKLRLKGFYESKNKKASKINSYDYIDEYINDYCAYMCKYFILKKIKN